MSLRMKGVEDGHVLLTTSFDFDGIKACNAVALIPSDFRILRDTSRYLRDPLDGLGLHAFDLVATDRFAKRYLRGDKREIETLKLACNDHLVELVVLIHHAELIIPDRFHGDRKKEEKFHKDRMLAFAKETMREHPGVRVLPVFIRIVNEGRTLEYVSFEGLLNGGDEKVIWTVPFSLRNVINCKYVLCICLDFRFRKESFDFVFSSLKIPYYNLLGAPGSCKGIVEGNETALVDIEKAIRAGGEEAVVIQHSGCAAYREITCGMSANEEEKYQRDQLLKSKDILKRKGFKDVFASYARRTEMNLLEFVVVK